MALTNVAMGTDKGWKSVTKDKAIRIFPDEKVSSNSGIIMCRLCKKYVTLTAPGIYARRFKHSRGDIEKNCKDFLMVFDFVDNASQYNMPYSLHRLFKLKKYRPGQTVLGKERAVEEALYKRGEKPEALIDYPVSAIDYEAVDVFNWQEAAGMISQMEFFHRVDVQSETVERYIREGKIIPDLVVPMSEHKQLKYFTEETLEATAKANGWKLINDSNRKGAVYGNGRANGYELFL